MTLPDNISFIINNNAMNTKNYIAPDSCIIEMMPMAPIATSDMDSSILLYDYEVLDSE